MDAFYLVAHVRAEGTVELPGGKVERELHGDVCGRTLRFVRHVKGHVHSSPPERPRFLGRIVLPSALERQAHHRPPSAVRQVNQPVAVLITGILDVSCREGQRAELILGIDRRAEIKPYRREAGVQGCPAVDIGQVGELVVLARRENAVIREFPFPSLLCRDEVCQRVGGINGTVRLPVRRRQACRFASALVRETPESVSRETSARLMLVRPPVWQTPA